MKVFDIINKVTASNIEARQNNNYYQLLINAQTVMDYIPELIEYTALKESEYRKMEAFYLDKFANEKGKNGMAEVMAKATDDYREWNKGKMFIDFSYDLVNLAKRLAVDTDKNLKSQI